LVVGEAYDPRDDRAASVSFSPRDAASWGRGGRAPLFIDRCADGSTHSLLIAGSGAYKTTSAVSTLLNWTGSAVVLDPAGELGPMLIDDRQRMGHGVFILTPELAHATGFNVLDWIDSTSPMAETDIGAVVEWICGQTPADDATAEFFKGRGKALITCLLAHMMWDPKLPAEQKTLRTLRAAVVTPQAELRKVLADPSDIGQPAGAGFGGFPERPGARDLFRSLRQCGRGHEVALDVGLCRSGLRQLVQDRRHHERYNGCVRCLAVEDVADHARHRPLHHRRSSDSAYEADGAVKGRILFFVDEAARLGPMSILEIARDAGRKYSITLQLLYQSVGQIVSQWGTDGKRAWFRSRFLACLCGRAGSGNGARAVRDHRGLWCPLLVGSAEYWLAWRRPRVLIALERQECHLHRKPPSADPARGDHA
jgi:type IV secretion system protein VirD4